MFQCPKLNRTSGNSLNVSNHLRENEKPQINCQGFCLFGTTFEAACFMFPITSLNQPPPFTDCFKHFHRDSFQRVTRSYNNRCRGKHDLADIFRLLVRRVFCLPLVSNFLERKFFTAFRVAALARFIIPCYCGTAFFEKLPRVVTNLFNN